MFMSTLQFMRGLEKVMLVVSTVEPGPGVEPQQSQPGPVGPGTRPATADPATPPGPAESPSKRVRLASAEEEEAGPCDSADSGAGGGADTAVESMDIDTECSSSQARLAGPEPGERWPATVEAETAAGPGVESSTGVGSGAMGGLPTGSACSSSDQAGAASGVKQPGIVEQEQNSEAEPAGSNGMAETEEKVGLPAAPLQHSQPGEETAACEPSVQSSEERSQPGPPSRSDCSCSSGRRFLSFVCVFIKFSC